MENQLLENIKLMLKSPDKDNAFIGIQLALQDIDKETKSEIFNILVKDGFLKEEDFKEDIASLFKQCSDVVIKNRIKPL